MTVSVKEKEILELISQLEKHHYESQVLELKSAAVDAPKIFDTLSGFSNQQQGGMILFGIDEEDKFNICGVYDAAKLQNRISEQCEEMDPVVRPEITIVQKSGKDLVAAEIPGIPYALRPCFYKPRGILKGSYKRVGEFNKPMNPLEIYQFQSFKMGLFPELDAVENASMDWLDQEQLKKYVALKIESRSHLALRSFEDILKISGLNKNEHPTKAGMMLFGIAPQLFFPEWAITAVVWPTSSRSSSGQLRFLDNLRIDNMNNPLPDAISVD